ncbi:hypothetical protein LguiB_018830 [Lonicera macranthoides]
MAAHLKEKKEALGEVLNGDRLICAPYKLDFLVEKDSEIVCKKKLTKEEINGHKYLIICQRYAYDEETADDQEETGWKYIHGDAFKYPKHKSLFAAALGSGTQLFIL